MLAVAARDLRAGWIVMLDGESCRVEDHELCPPTTVQLMVALTLRTLGDGTVSRVCLPADAWVERLVLPEREVECLYVTDSSFVLFDPLSYEQYDVARGVATAATVDAQTGQRLVAGFWRGQPVTLGTIPS